MGDGAGYPHPRPQTLFLVMSGPSGAGKSTLLHRFLPTHDDFVKSISTTTRPPRAGERDGVDYHFVGMPEFRRQIDEGRFLEYAEYDLNWYGTPRAFIDRCFAAGRSVIKDIDVQGAAQLRMNWPGTVFVFVVPSTHAEIERRLRTRSTDAPDVIARRLAACDRELAHWPGYDYLVINDDLDQAVADLGMIVAAERLQVARERR